MKSHMAGHRSGFQAALLYTPRLGQLMSFVCKKVIPLPMSMLHVLSASEDCCLTCKALQSLTAQVQLSLNTKACMASASMCACLHTQLLMSGSQGLQRQHPAGYRTRALT